MIEIIGCVYANSLTDCLTNYTETVCVSTIQGTINSGKSWPSADRANTSTSRIGKNRLRGYPHAYTTPLPPNNNSRCLIKTLMLWMWTKEEYV